MMGGLKPEGPKKGECQEKARSFVRAARAIWSCPTSPLWREAVVDVKLINLAPPPCEIRHSLGGGAFMAAVSEVMKVSRLEFKATPPLTSEVLTVATRNLNPLFQNAESPCWFSERVASSIRTESFSAPTN